MDKTYKGIGIMSGTSLDGLDIAYVEFTQGSSWSFDIGGSTTLPYPATLKTQLHECFGYSAKAFQQLDRSYGRWIGEQVSLFMKDNHCLPDFIASHGHTIFHEPNLGFTTQIGSGAALFAASSVPTVCDFRSVDVACGGQGAPLVPIGDLELFPTYELLLNLGGIANISQTYRNTMSATAFDITIANMGLNYFANKLGHEYDKNGEISRSGQCQKDLLCRLNELPFFFKPAPKSLGREFFESEFLPCILEHDHSVKDILCTLSHHLAYQIALSINTMEALSTKPKLLITGGGALNGFVVELIGQYCKTVEVVIPHIDIVQYKEALIFAFLGLKRLLQQDNTLKSVTGAQKDSIGGALYGPHPYLR